MFNIGPRCVCLVFCLMGLTGCLSLPDTDVPEWHPPADASAPAPTPEPTPEETPSWPEACEPTAAEAEVLSGVAERLERSARELRACGEAVMNIADHLPLTIFFSTDSFFDHEILVILSQWRSKSPFSPPLEQTAQPDLRASEVADSVLCEAHFFTADGVAVTADPFDLSAYFEGAEVTVSMDFDEMLAQPDTPNRYEIRWQTEGPLSAVLFPQGVPAERVVIFEASLNQFLALLGYGQRLPPDMGVFEHLSDLQMGVSVETFHEGSEAINTLFQTPILNIETHRRRGGFEFDLNHLGSPLPASAAGRVTYRREEQLVGTSAYTQQSADTGWALSLDYWTNTLNYGCAEPSADPNTQP